MLPLLLPRCLGGGGGGMELALTLFDVASSDDTLDGRFVLIDALRAGGGGGGKSLG